MYIPKKSHFEILLNRKNSSSSNDDTSLNNDAVATSTTSGSNSSSVSHWSEICTGFIKDIVFMRRCGSFNGKNERLPRNTIDKSLTDPSLCLNQLSEFQKSYVSFPDFDPLDDESDAESFNTANDNPNNGNYWTFLSPSPSSTYK